MAEPPEEVVDKLYGAPLDEFTARRDARAKELRGSDREAAGAVKKLRKPSVSAWAVNQLARQAPDDVEALLAAGAALRQAQLGGGDRDSIRESSRDEREAVERLVSGAAALLRKAGRGAGDAALEEVRETLRAAASDEEARELIRRGVLTAARRPVGLGGFEAAFAAGPAVASGAAEAEAEAAAPARVGRAAEPKPPPRPKPKPKKGARKKPDDDAAAEDAERKRDTADADDAERRRDTADADDAERGRAAAAAADDAERKRAAAAEAERRRTAKARVKEARAALKESERAARDADRALAAAERGRDAARDALDRAEEELSGAREAADGARGERERRRAELEAAEGEA
jgi:hypothetical protein